MNDRTVLVVGAGPSGLAMAAELRRQGVAARVIDKSSGVTSESRALGLNARSMEVFAMMGIADAFLARAKVIEGFTPHGGNGAAIGRFAFDLADALTPYPHEYVLPQSETQRLLAAHLEELGGAIEWHTELTGLEPDPEGVTVRLRGANGTDEQARFAWLVAADGASSTVRHALGLQFDGAEYPESFLLADVAIEWALSERDAHIFLLPDGPFVAFPYPEAGRWRLVDTSGQASTGEAAPAVARFQALFDEMGLPAKVSHPRWTSLFRIHRRLVRDFRPASRVFLVGDAAHIHSPAGGQGLNTGVQDAVNLSWKLALAVRGRAGELLLDSYGIERRPVAEEVLRMSNRLTQGALLRGRAAAHFRDAALRTVLSFGFVHRRASHVAAKLDLHYSESPIFAESRRVELFGRSPDAPALLEAGAFGNAVRPGHRGPTCARDKSADILPLLHEAAGRHLLLLFPGEAGHLDLAALTEAFNSFADLLLPVVVGAASDGLRSLPDPTGGLHKAYGARAACLFLLRPDGYVAFRAQPPDAAKLRDYLARVFAPA